MLNKEYTKTGRSCRVTFILPNEADAEKVCLVGDFNGWDPTTHPMKRAKSGEYKITVSLKPGQTYDFRYILDGERWENDWAADGYRSNAFGSENSYVMV